MTEHQKSFEIQSSKAGSSSSITNKKKRKLSVSSIDESIASDEESVNHGNVRALLVDEPPNRKRAKSMTGVRLPGLVYPPSLYRPYDEQAITTLDLEEDVLRSTLVRMTSLSLL